MSTQKRHVNERNRQIKVRNRQTVRNIIKTTGSEGIKRNQIIEKTRRLKSNNKWEKMSTRTLRNILREFKKTEAIREEKHRLYWRGQYERLRVIEKLVDSLALSMEQQIGKQLVEEKISTRLSIQEIATYIMNTQVLIFIPTAVNSERKQTTRYDLTYVSVDDFNMRFEEVWSNIKRRRELRKKNLIEKI